MAEGRDHPGGSAAQGRGRGGQSGQTEGGSGGRETLLRAAPGRQGRRDQAALCGRLCGGRAEGFRHSLQCALPRSAHLRSRVGQLAGVERAVLVQNMAVRGGLPCGERGPGLSGRRGTAERHGRIGTGGRRPGTGQAVGCPRAQAPAGGRQAPPEAGHQCLSGSVPFP